MSIAMPAATRLQDADDINVTLGAGVDEYTLTWDNDTAKFVLRAPAAPFAGILATGATVGATSQAQAFTVGVTVGSVATPATLLQVAETSTSSPRGIMSSQHNTGVDGARFHMRKSRGTNAAPTVITTGDVLGRLVASGYDGANYLEMGGIDIVSAGTIASTRVPTEIRFLTATDAAPSVLTQRMVIDKAGNVGIGTATPGSKLDVVTGAPGGTALTNNGISFQSNTHSYICINTPTNMQQAVSFYAAGVVKGSFGYEHGSRGDYTFINAVNGTVEFTQAGTSKMRLVNGAFGIGTTGPATALHAVSTTATTNDLRNVLTLGANVTGAGVGAAGLGAGLLFTMETSTTVDTSAASVQAIWYEATHATRKADLVLNAYDTAIREGLRIRGDGSGPAIGFYGVAPIARAVLATGAGATVDNVITALQNLGLVKQS